MTERTGDYTPKSGVYDPGGKCTASLANLTASDHAIVVQTSPANGFRDIFCGDNRRAA